jgi:hypothetical protein
MSEPQPTTAGATLPPPEAPAGPLTQPHQGPPTSPAAAPDETGTMLTMGSRATPPAGI